MEIPVGASLLAIAVVQSTSLLKVSPSSRASSLPQWFVVNSSFLNICFAEFQPL
ncbi:hypothetical protein J3D54_003396 [Pseudomonas sp. GGS8]|nr:hypothetical protein [Pseudomonas sp. GGS8]